MKYRQIRTLIFLTLYVIYISEDLINHYHEVLNLEFGKPQFHINCTNNYKDIVRTFFMLNNYYQQIY